MMVTYYEESGILASGASQPSPPLWVTILIGRFDGVPLRKNSVKIIRALTTESFFPLPCTDGRPPASDASGTIGLASLFPACTERPYQMQEMSSDATLWLWVFRHPVRFGSIITPSIIGTIMEHTGIRVSMRSSWPRRGAADHGNLQ